MAELEPSAAGSSGSWSPSTPDGELLAAARAGDGRALECLLERHQAEVYRFGMKMCRNPADAEDVVQDTLLAMARGVRDFRGASSLSTWLYTIARSHCIKKRRRGKLAPEAVQDTRADRTPDDEGRRLAHPGRGPDEALAGKQLTTALEQAVAALEPMYREVLLLRDAEGLTANEVAEVLGVTPQAVKSRLHRARLAVRARIAPLLGIGSDLAAAPGTCPDVLSMLSRYLEGEIGNEQCAEMERHLEGCPRCRGACASLKQTLALCRNGGAAADVPAAVRARVKTALRAFLADGDGARAGATSTGG